MAFNNVGAFTIEPNQSYRLDWWYFEGGDGDHGAQYFSAHPLKPPGNDVYFASLLISDQTKTLWTDGIYYYGFRVTNLCPGHAVFSVQGGGFS
jgi:hypothetical protein